jgi:hypothetical protein
VPKKKAKLIKKPGKTSKSRAPRIRRTMVARKRSAKKK